MNRRTQIFLVAALGVVFITTLGLVYASQVAAQGNSLLAQRLPQRWEYSAKFLCGTSSLQSPSVAQPDVNPGIYTTKVNIHNPNAQTVTLLKKVVLAFPEAGQPITPTVRFPDTLRSDFAMSVNCAEIVRLLDKNGTPVPPNTTFVEGYLVVDALPLAGTLLALPQLDVDAAYTTAPLPPATGGVSSVDGIQVNRVPGRVLPAGTWPF